MLVAPDLLIEGGDIIVILMIVRVIVLHELYIPLAESCLEGGLRSQLGASWGLS